MSLFITLEGGEGVGKSTNLAFVEQLLKKRGLDVVVSREPGGTEMAEQIRELVLAPREETVDPLSELLLIFAARKQHLSQVLEPALKMGKTVLCDRFVDATYAYQGYGRGFDHTQISMLESMVVGATKPDLTLLLDAPVETGMSRARNRGELDRFEQEKNLFFEKVRSGYLERATKDPERFVIVDCSLPLEDVQQQIQQKLEHYFQKHTL